MSGDPVRVAQVGLGNWGQNLVRNLDVLADLVWICDSSEARREQFGDTVHDELLGQVDPGT